jgi:hypothetical protein
MQSMRCLCQILILFICSGIFFARTPAQIDSLTSAEVIFTLDFPASQPEHYSIRIPSDGLAHYKSSGRLSPDSDVADDFDLDFTLTPETRRRIFELSAKVGYFQKDIDSHKNIAFSGKKTLAYRDAKRSGTETYNYSQNPTVQELTTLMQNLSATLEFGHRLEYDHHYQKLALEDELKKMEDLSRNNELGEISAIRPILTEIVDDQAVINVTRARAQRLLERAGIH